MLSLLPIRHPLSTASPFVFGCPLSPRLRARAWQVGLRVGGSVGQWRAGGSEDAKAGAFLRRDGRAPGRAPGGH
eukprot:8615407-Pyramimonas_sp.AAC.1